MIYHVVFFDRRTEETWIAGVYAPDEDQARQIGAILLSRKYAYVVAPDKCRVIPVPGLTSPEMTTT